MSDIMEKIRRSELKSILRTLCSARRSVFQDECCEIRDNARKDVEASLKPILEAFYQECKGNGMIVECYRGCLETFKITEGHPKKERLDELDKKREKVSVVRDEIDEKITLAEDATELKSIMTELKTKLKEI